MLTILLMSLNMFQTHLMEALPPDEVYQIHALSSRHPPSPRPGNPSRPPFRPQSQQSGPQKSFKRYNGPIYLPPQIYKLLSQDAMKALKAYNVEKLQFSLFLIFCCPEILNFSWLSWYLLLKIACLHVSLTANENFYKLSKMHCHLI